MVWYIYTIWREGAQNYLFNTHTKKKKKYPFQKISKPKVFFITKYFVRKYLVQLQDYLLLIWKEKKITEESSLLLAIQNCIWSKSQKELFRRQFCTGLLMTRHIKKVDIQKKTQTYSIGKDPFFVAWEPKKEPQKNSVCHQERYYTPKTTLQPAAFSSIQFRLLYF